MADEGGGGRPGDVLIPGERGGRGPRYTQRSERTASDRRAGCGAVHNTRVCSTVLWGGYSVCVREGEE